MVQIDLARDEGTTPFAKELLASFYLREGETSPQEAYARAAIAYSAGDAALAQRLYDYASKGWFMFASPLLSNAVLPGEAWKALPVSCFLTYVPDTVEGLLEHTNELRWLSILGGGVGGHWSDIRSVSKKAPGPVPFLKTVDADMTAYRQGTTRKGSYAAYMDASHPDILEFLQIRVPTGGDPNRKCLNLFNAVNCPDEIYVKALNDEPWDLIDPNDGTVRDTIPARALLQQIVETRFRTGTPYILNIDTANRDLPEPLKEKGYKIHGSNLCIEIMEPTDENHTAVCVLSSLNLAKWDDIVPHLTQVITDLITMLDNVTQVFIDHAPAPLAKAVRSATKQRSLGLGGMGWHTYLQEKNIPWESAMATSHNRTIWRSIKEAAVAATERLARERGEYPDGPGSGRRNSLLLAIAPNANSAIPLGVSPGCDPIKSNAYAHATRAGTHLVRNPTLERVLAQKIPDAVEREKVWAQITQANGSVRGVDALDEWEKDVFATAFEIDQKWTIEHAAQRQPWICQGQSTNLFFPAGADRHYVLKTHIDAWARGLKGLYYLRTSAGEDADKVGARVERVPLKDHVEDEGCVSCQG